MKFFLIASFLFTTALAAHISEHHSHQLHSRAMGPMIQERAGAEEKFANEKFANEKFANEQQYQNQLTQKAIMQAEQGIQTAEQQYPINAGQSQQKALNQKALQEMAAQIASAEQEYPIEMINSNTNKHQARALAALAQEKFAEKFAEKLAENFAQQEYPIAAVRAARAAIAQAKAVMEQQDDSKLTQTANWNQALKSKSFNGDEAKFEQAVMDRMAAINNMAAMPMTPMKAVRDTSDPANYQFAGQTEQKQSEVEGQQTNALQNFDLAQEQQMELSNRMANGAKAGISSMAKAGQEKQAVEQQQWAEMIMDRAGMMMGGRPMMVSGGMARMGGQPMRQMMRM